MLSGYELEKSFERKSVPPPVEFDELWPSETSGNGQVVLNNSRNGAAQGKGSFLLKAHCRLCGFPNDMSRTDHSGGSLDGNGAGGSVSLSTVTATLNNGTTHTEGVGTQSFRNASGCALCFTKNSTKQRILLTAGDPWNKPRNLGF